MSLGADHVEVCSDHACHPGIHVCRLLNGGDEMLHGPDVCESGLGRHDLCDRGPDDHELDGRAVDGREFWTREISDHEARNAWTRSDETENGEVG